MRLLFLSASKVETPKLFRYANFEPPADCPGPVAGSNAIFRRTTPKEVDRRNKWPHRFQKGVNEFPFLLIHRAHPWLGHVQEHTFRKITGESIFHPVVPGCVCVCSHVQIETCVPFVLDGVRDDIETRALTFIDVRRKSADKHLPREPFRRLGTVRVGRRAGAVTLPRERKHDERRNKHLGREIFNKRQLTVLWNPFG